MDSPSFPKSRLIPGYSSLPTTAPDKGNTLQKPFAGNELPGTPAQPTKDRTVISSAAERLLAQGYERLRQGSESTQASGGVSASNTTTTPAASAGVILNFISQRLTTMQAGGAELDELKQTFEKGLEGFRKGLAEATSILQKLDALNDDVQAGIDETEQRVLGGLQALAEQLGLGEYNLVANEAPAAATDDQAAAGSNSVASTSNSEPARYVRSSAALFASRIERNESVELELTTRDGDVITLSLNNSSSSERAGFAGVASDSGNRAALLAYQQVERSSSQFGYTVEGDLDEGELEALRLLFEDISKLSETFFDGEFDKAFNMAMELRFDSSEFSSLSLDMSLITRAAFFAGASTNNQQSPAGTPELAQRSAPAASAVVPEDVAAFKRDNELSRLQQLFSMLDLADRFGEPKQLLSELLADRLARVTGGSTAA